MDRKMFAIYTCLLALISSGFSFREALPWDRNHITKISAHRHGYGASKGFKVANIKDYPYLTSVIYESELFPAGAGAIVNKHWVLSTAYASLLTAPEMKIYIETNNAGRSGQRFNVTKIVRHEKFNTERPLEYNIALLKTEKPIKFSDKAKPVKFGNSVPKAGTECNLLGYGYLQNNHYVGWNLGVATVQVKSKDECEAQHGALRTAYCAEVDGVVPCYGDVGNLLMYKNKLVGIYVLGDYCNQVDKAEVYTNIPAMKKWIRKTIRKNSNINEMEGIFEDQFLED